MKDKKYKLGEPIPVKFAFTIKKDDCKINNDNWIDALNNSKLKIVKIDEEL